MSPPARLLPALLPLLLLTRRAAAAGTKLDDITNGLTFSFCSFPNDCVAPRTCRSFNGRDACHGPDDSCVCVPPAFARCAQHADCPRGERCARFVHTPHFCLSAARTAESVAVAPADSSFAYDCPAPTPEPDAPAPTPQPTLAPDAGLSYDRCADSDDCASGRSCVDLHSSGYDCCSPANNATCACIPDAFVFCAGDADCDDGEACLGTPVDPARCVSAAARADFGGEAKAEDEVCVDAAALQGVPARELVYARHRRARVLCDASGSCATPGHMVRWRQRVVMMKSYCAEVGCAEDVRLVNSPRYRVGRVVQSSTEGLVFTAFAARFESRAEERVLAVLSRVGL